jgi:UDP-GlcNAc:undecaprenyl-phosphate GlcNAc-1-phosphate transferase
MLPQVLLALAAFSTTLAITPVCRAVCLRFGWADQPDFRKVHRIPIPRTGGIAVFLGYAAAFGLLALPPLNASPATARALPGIYALFPAVLVVFCTGLLDDGLGLKPWAKILGQIVAGALACHAGVRIQSVAGYPVAGAWWHIPLTIFWLVGCTNAFNLIDGLDGLAAGVGLFATATALFNALLTGNVGLALATAPLLGALLGFLPYNFSPASIFMGDCGSLTVGFLLGCFGVVWSQKSATLLGMTAPLIALAYPILDTALTIARRYLRHQRVFTADRGHIHHRLLARGLTTRRVVYVLYAFSGVSAGVALLGTQNHLGAILLVAFCGIVWFAVQYLGYEEFDAARRLLFGGLFRNVLNANLSIRQLEHSVEAARTLEDCWAALREGSRKLGFSEASLHFHECRFTARFQEAGAGECWNLWVPLNGSGHVLLFAPFHSSLPPAAISAFAESLWTVFAGRLHHLHVEQSASFTPALHVLAASVTEKAAPGEGRLSLTAGP